NYKSAALNQLSYAGDPHTKAVFSEFFKSWPVTERYTSIPAYHSFVHHGISVSVQNRLPYGLVPSN
ncbi:MAG TPA: hypothetical protein VKE29_03615, partial [Candidatus Udaeobacter sp.]|nr:hypothetical protein [Candidatus Udaeobacter sp.]